MEYKIIHSEEGYHDNIPLGIKVEIATDIDVNPDEKRILRKALDEIRYSILTRTIAQDEDKMTDVEKEREQLMALFPPYLPVREIQNGYCKNWCCAHRPWYVVTTANGDIKIGWRKRVIQIEWLYSTINKTAQELFPDEDVTKDDYMIHAWGYEKAKEYIDKLLNS